MFTMNFVWNSQKITAVAAIFYKFFSRIIEKFSNKFDKIGAIKL